MLVGAAATSSSVGCHYLSSKQANGKDLVELSVTVDLWQDEALVQHRFPFFFLCLCPVIFRSVLIKTSETIHQT